jgi:hypothetical protein
MCNARWESCSLIGFYIMLSLLTIITIFGVGISINMIFRQWWLAFVLYLLLMAFVIARAVHVMLIHDWVILGIGFAGAIFATWGARAMKGRGYALFR